MWVTKSVFNGPASIKYRSPTHLYWPNETPMSANVGIAYYDVGNTNLVFAFSDDSGSTWSTALVDSGGDAGDYCELVFITTNTWGIIYYDRTADDWNFAVSTDNGDNWTVYVVDSTGGTVGTAAGLSELSSVAAVDTETLVCTYFRGSGSGNDLYFGKSTDQGQTWSTSLLESTDVLRHNDIQVVDEDTYILTYYNSTSTQLEFRKTTNGGTTWGSAVTVDTGGTIGENTSLAVVDADTYIVIYWDQTNDDLLFSKTTNGGTTWSSPVTIDANVSLAGSSAFAYGGWAIEVEDADTYVVSYMSRVGTEGIRFAKTTNGGTSWTTTGVEALTTTDELPACITILDEDNYLIAHAGASANDVRVSTTTNGGTSWSNALAVNTGVVSNVTIAASTGRRPKPVNFE